MSYFFQNNPYYQSFQYTKQLYIKNFKGLSKEGLLKQMLKFCRPLNYLT